MKRALKTILHSTILLGSAVAAVITLNIPIIIAMVPVATISAAKLADDISGNEVDNSIFSVSNDGKIVQNTLAKPFRFLKLLGKKDKTEAFKEEAVNMFIELKEKDDEGNKIEYSTVSHALTYKLLKDLEKNGYIEDLNRTDAKESRLLFAKLTMGNSDVSSKKRKMYNISFKLTDKERRYEELLNLDQKREDTDNVVIVDNSKEIKNEEDRNKEIEEQLRILKNYREELENRDTVEENKRKVM
ncbi:MAG: hypothetical protein IKF36_06565 [Bacilli bacterium]|nr:hypothetical protein [Bacilli bacterium]